MIPHPLLAAAIARPDHPAIVTPTGTLTTRELRDRVARRAGGLARLGVRPGQTVAARADADVELVITLHALGWLGAACLPIAAKATDDELAAILPHAELRLGALPGGVAVEDADPAPPRDWPLDEVRLVVATSGTTGAPRTIPITTLQLLTSAFGSAIRLGHLPTDRWIAVLPLHHVGGLSILFRCAWSGATVLLHPRFDPADVDRAIEDGASLLSVVPTMLERLLDARGDRPFPPTLRAILLGGAAAPGPLLERCRRIGAPVARSWGMTEAASQIATSAPGDYDGGLSPLPFAAVEVVDERLHVRGPIVRDGALATSDRGRIDALGRVHVLGRADDVLISGGENVDPAEIEAVLLAHPAVREVAVVGIPDPTWGERPAAFLVGEPVPDEDLAAWCRRTLSGFKVPARFTWIDALPRNALGKVERRKLR